MNRRRFLAFGALSAGNAAGESGRIVYMGRSFGSDPLPSFDRGFLFFSGHPNRLAAYGPDGALRFDVMLPTSSIGNAATDARGLIAVRRGAGIALLDRSGKQVRAIETGRYMPSHLCFDERGALWTAGWQRGEIDPASEDPGDYAPVRRFDAATGRETGRFLDRRQRFPGKMDPFPGGLGLWQLRASNDRVGALASLNQSGKRGEWVEWSLDGEWLDRWPVPEVGGGFAFTAGAELYTQQWDRQTHAMTLHRLDRTARQFTPAGSPPADFGLLLGAEGNELVFADRGGYRLHWYTPPV